MTAQLRALTGSGFARDDPSEGLLFELLLDVERGDEEFVIVERTNDPTNQTYAQVIKNGDGTWLVERRDGSPDEHYRVICPDQRTAHEVQTAWAFELEGWRENPAWEHASV